jgi:hypothetical protein
VAELVDVLGSKDNVVGVPVIVGKVEIIDLVSP